jgi:hypothetical protein
MNFARHNHQIFEIPKNGVDFYYYAIGGQYTNLIDGVSTILANCERLDYKTNKWYFNIYNWKGDYCEHEIFKGRIFRIRPE